MKPLSKAVIGIIKLHKPTLHCDVLIRIIDIEIIGINTSSTTFSIFYILHTPEELVNVLFKMMYNSSNLYFIVKLTVALLPVDAF